MTAPTTQSLVAADAHAHLVQRYMPAWRRLLLHEGSSSAYPMPPSEHVTDLLDVLKNTRGSTIRSNPPTSVTEGLGYALFVAGMQRDLPSLKSLAVAWQANGQGFGGNTPCGGCCSDDDHRYKLLPKQVCALDTPLEGSLCRTVPGAYMPAWKMPIGPDAGSLGSATDGDEDAVTGIIYLAELLDSDEARAFAVKSIAAFVLEDLGLAAPRLNSRRVPAAGDIPHSLQTIWLWRGGSCWGGYDTSARGDAANRNLCVAPAYFSPGQWRLFARYLQKHARLLPDSIGHSASQLSEVLLSAITWGYNLLHRISCPNGLVSNWWTLPGEPSKWPWQGRLLCKNSGTAAGEYGPDAVRIPWRVALDFVWFPSARTPLFNEHGRRIGTWGAREYSQRWASAWRAAVVNAFSGSQAEAGAAGSFPPLREGAVRLRPDQVLPLLSQLPPCEHCPGGMTATPWAGWGSYPIVTGASNCSILSSVLLLCNSVSRMSISRTLACSLHGATRRRAEGRDAAMARLLRERGVRGHHARALL